MADKKEFYSLKETAEKLKKTEAEIMELVKQKKLNRYGGRGENSKFKVTEVEQLKTSLAEETAAFKIVEETAEAQVTPAEGEKGLDTGTGLDLEGSGSGNGLLDLSLQADDSKLGAVLEDIYPEAGEGEPSIPVEAEGVPKEEAVPPAPAAVPTVRRIVQAAPDTMSNAFGDILFLPIMAIILVAVTTLSGNLGFIPGIMS